LLWSTGFLNLDFNIDKPVKLAMIHADPIDDSKKSIKIPDFSACDLPSWISILELLSKLA
jgi:hypothetical protein